MTSTQIREWRERQFLRDKGRKVELNTMPDPLGFCLSEIALQLALFNEHQARMEARYMEMTAPAVKRKQEARSQKPKAQWETTQNL